jgi:phosphate:Na+ symporter
METMSDWFFLIMGLSGGLAIFLLGMDRTVSGLKGLAGNRLRWILGHLTGNRWYGAATGAGITAVIQSSSVTTALIKDRPKDELIKTRYLSDDLLATPSIALDRARMEIARMGTRVRDMVGNGVPAAIPGTEEQLTAVEAADDEVDELHAQVVAYLGRISEVGITREQTNELLGLLEAAGDIEAIGDAVETNLVADGRRRLEAGIVISSSTEAIIDDLAAEVLTALDIAVGAVGRGSYEAARRATKMKPEITALTADAREHQLERLTVDEPNRVDAYRIENDIIEDLKRIYYYVKRAARVGVPNGEPSESQ